MKITVHAITWLVAIVRAHRGWWLARLVGRRGWSERDRDSSEEAGACVMRVCARELWERVRECVCVCAVEARKFVCAKCVCA